MTEITCEALNENAFQMIGKDWLLLTAKKDGKVNTMTASWGGVGVMWGKLRTGYRRGKRGSVFCGRETRVYL